MKIRFVYKICPVFIRYTDNMPDWKGGENFGPYVKIRPKYFDDEGLLQHELVHAKQFYRFPFDPILYKFLKKWRLKSEVEAYKVQSKLTPNIPLELYAERIYKYYGLDVTFEKILEMLKDLKAPSLPPHTPP